MGKIYMGLLAILIGVPILVIYLVGKILSTIGDSLTVLSDFLNEKLAFLTIEPPSTKNRLKALGKVRRRAAELREAQKEYMAHRGNEVLGKKVGEASARLDEALQESEA